MQGVTREALGLSIAAEVSIHTPVQGVTSRGASVYQRRKVSIHTPVQGVTSIQPDGHRAPGCFNPHSRAGSDQNKELIDLILSVSIHTPVQGVTSDPVFDAVQIIVSIHTPVQGVTYGLYEHLSKMLFQSTLPCRE